MEWAVEFPQQDLWGGLCKQASKALLIQIGVKAEVVAETPVAPSEYEQAQGSVVSYKYTTISYMRHANSARCLGLRS
jgi:hypothetical protein